MFKTLLLAVAGVILLAGAVRPAAAVPITYDVTFAGAGFTSSPSTVVPYPLVQGHFTVTLTRNATSTGPAGITMDFITTGLSSPLTYSYSGFSDELVVGGSDGGPFSLGAGVDFELAILDVFSINPQVVRFQYSYSGTVYTAQLTTLHMSQVVASVPATTPIPPALPLFVSALGGLGFLGWRRRKAAA